MRGVPRDRREIKVEFVLIVAILVNVSLRCIVNGSAHSLFYVAFFCLITRFPLHFSRVFLFFFLIVSLPNQDRRILFFFFLSLSFSFVYS